MRIISKAYACFVDSSLLEYDFNYRYNSEYRFNFHMILVLTVSVLLCLNDMGGLDLTSNAQTDPNCGNIASSVWLLATVA